MSQLSCLIDTGYITESHTHKQSRKLYNINTIFVPSLSNKSSTELLQKTLEFPYPWTASSLHIFLSLMKPDIVLC